MKMITTAAVYTVLLALSGCALSPADLRDKGPRHAFAMRQAPAGAAACVARNAENSGGGIMGRVNTAVRDAATAGNMELVVFSNDVYFLVAEFSPAQNGARAVAWVNPRTLDAAAKRFLEAFDGC